jgi:hypothetical protein
MVFALGWDDRVAMPRDIRLLPTGGVRSVGPRGDPPLVPLFSGPFLSSSLTGEILMTDGRTTRILDFGGMTIREIR